MRNFSGVYHLGMRWKQDLTPLDDVPNLDGWMRSKLIANHITTAEELLGQIEAEPASVSTLLDADQRFMVNLRGWIESAIPADALQAIESQRGREYPLGPLPPDEQQK